MIHEINPDLSEPSDTELLLKFNSKLDRDRMRDFLSTWDTEEELPSDTRAGGV